jgi:CheY-like chemotaxis protein
VLKHEGAKIWAESAGEGKGSTFFLQLPRLAIKDDSHSPPRSFDNLHAPLHLDSMHGHRLRRGSSDLDDRYAKTLQMEARREKSIAGAPTADTPEHLEAHMHNELQGPQLAVPAPLHPVSSSSSSSLSILVADDSVMNRKILVRLLKGEGHACLEAVDGLDALGCVSRFLLKSQGSRIENSTSYSSSAKASSQCLDVQAIDVVLIDSNMPRMSGPEATREMRKLGFKGAIIGITGDSSSSEAFLRAGADSVMVKPVNNEQLTSVIATTIAATTVAATTAAASAPQNGASNQGSVQDTEGTSDSILRDTSAPKASSAISGKDDKAQPPQRVNLEDFVRQAHVRSTHKFSFFSPAVFHKTGVRVAPIPEVEEGSCDPSREGGSASGSK